MLIDFLIRFVLIFSDDVSSFELAVGAVANIIFPMLCCDAFGGRAFALVWFSLVFELLLSDPFVSELLVLLSISLRSMYPPQSQQYALPFVPIGFVAMCGHVSVSRNIRCCSDFFLS